MSNGRLNQVLLVGEASARLEVDFVPYGLACVGVDSATEAVARMKGSPFALVVVADHLPDMTGPAFVEGLLRHFDPSSVVLVGDVDAQQAAQLQRSPKVTIFPSAADGAAIADHLFQRANGSAPPTSAPPAPSFPGPGSGRGMFETPRTGAASFPPSSAPLGGPPPPLAPVGANPWPSPQQTPISGVQPRPPGTGAPGSTMPFFAAFGAAQQQQQQAQQQQQQQQQQPMSMPPVSSGPDRATMERIEQMATELAQANADVVTLRARLSAAEAAQRDGAERLVAAEGRALRAEQEASSLRGEVDAARRSAINQVAEVMALSDEGEPITAELDDLKSRVDMAEGERDSAASQLSMVRDERDRLTKELVDARQQFQERSLELDNLRRQLLESHADVEQARAAAETAEHLVRDLEVRANAGAEASAALAAAHAELDAVRALLAEKDFESARALEEQARTLTGQLVEQAAAASAAVDAVRAEAAADKDAAIAAVRAELEAAHAADVDALVDVRTHQAARAAVEIEKRATEGLLLQMKTELDAIKAEKSDIEAAWAADQQRAAELETKLGEEQAARLDVENGLRADLNESLKQLNTEMQNSALESARAERSVADAAALRQMLEGLTHEQARLMGEMESLRPLAAEVDKARATVVDMQRQLEAALGTDEKDGDANRAIDEAVKAQTRELLELARALEPFTWGLQRAAAFFADKNIDGAVDHLRALNLLEKTLERMKSELDRVHTN